MSKNLQGPGGKRNNNCGCASKSLLNADDENTISDAAINQFIQLINSQNTGGGGGGGGGQTGSTGSTGGCPVICDFVTATVLLTGVTANLGSINITNNVISEQSNDIILRPDNDNQVIIESGLTTLDDHTYLNSTNVSILCPSFILGGNVNDIINVSGATDDLSDRGIEFHWPERVTSPVSGIFLRRGFFGFNKETTKTKRFVFWKRAGIIGSSNSCNLKNYEREGIEPNEAEIDVIYTNEIKGSDAGLAAGTNLSINTPTQLTVTATGGAICSTNFDWVFNVRRNEIHNIGIPGSSSTGQFIVQDVNNSTQSKIELNNTVPELNLYNSRDIHLKTFSSIIGQIFLDSGNTISEQALNDITLNTINGNIILNTATNRTISLITDIVRITNGIDFGPNTLGVPSAGMSVPARTVWYDDTNTNKRLRINNIDHFVVIENSNVTNVMQNQIAIFQSGTNVLQHKILPSAVTITGTNTLNTTFLNVSNNATFGGDIIIKDSNETHTYTISPGDLTSNVLLCLPDGSAFVPSASVIGTCTDTFVFENATQTLLNKTLCSVTNTVAASMLYSCNALSDPPTKVCINNNPSGSGNVLVTTNQTNAQWVPLSAASAPNLTAVYQSTGNPAIMQLDSSRDTFIVQNATPDIGSNLFEVRQFNNNINFAISSIHGQFGDSTPNHSVDVEIYGNLTIKKTGSNNHSLIFENNVGTFMYIIDPIPTSNRTLSFPSFLADDTFLFEDTVQIITNKTMTSNTNNVTAKGLFSDGGANTVSVVGAANPVAGEVLQATSPFTAVWAPVSGSGTTPTLQQVYNVSNPAQIILNAANNGITILDANPSIGSTLFDIVNNGGAANYFSVSTTDVNIGDVMTTVNLTVNGKLTVTGLIDPTGLILSRVSANPDPSPDTIWIDSNPAGRLMNGNRPIVVGPVAPSTVTDNSLPRFDAPIMDPLFKIKGSGVILDDSNAMTGLLSLTSTNIIATNNLISRNTLSVTDGAGIVTQFIVNQTSATSNIDIIGRTSLSITDAGGATNRLVVNQTSANFGDVSTGDVLPVQVFGNLTIKKTVATDNFLIFEEAGIGPVNRYVIDVDPTSTRLLTFPSFSANDTFLFEDAVQTATNKTMIAPTNNIISRGLFSNSGANIISTFAAANPTIGQMLTATSGTTATWQSITLQNLYDNSPLMQQFVLNNTNGGIYIQDAATPITGNLFNIVNNGNTANYFSVSTTDVIIGDGATTVDLTVNGKLTVTGLIDPTGLVLTRVPANPSTIDTIWIDSTAATDGRLMNGTRPIVVGPVAPSTVTHNALVRFDATPADQFKIHGSNVILSNTDAMTGLTSITSNNINAHNSLNVTDGAIIDRFVVNQTSATIGTIANNIPLTVNGDIIGRTILNITNAAGATNRLVVNQTSARFGDVSMNDPLSVQIYGDLILRKTAATTNFLIFEDFTNMNAYTIDVDPTSNTTLVFPSFLTPTDTFVFENTVQSMTNKTFTGSTNTIAASQFRTSSASPANDVIITSTTPTGSGQALVTTSATTATWQTVGTTNPTLQNVYDNSATPATILLSSAAKDIILVDSSSFSGNKVFVIEDKLVTPIEYLSVSSNDVIIGESSNNIVLTVNGDLTINDDNATNNALMFERLSNTYSIEPFFTNAPTVSARFVFPVITANDTFVFQNTVQSMTNKTFTGSTNTIAASQFRTSSASPANDVIITSTTPTGSGQALVTTSATTATWQTVVTTNPTLQTVYDNSATPASILLSSATKNIIIVDSATLSGNKVFIIEDKLVTPIEYLSVSSNDVIIGTVTNNIPLTVNGDVTINDDNATNNALIFERSGNAYSIEPFFTNAPTVSAIFDFPVITANDTFVFQNTVQSMTNKTFTGSTNTIAASQFRTSSASPANDVIITSTTPTGSGQALVTTSATTATWQTVGTTNPTLQTVYDNSATPASILLSSATKNIIIVDSATLSGNKVFVIEDKLVTPIEYLSVSSNDVIIGEVANNIPLTVNGNLTINDDNATNNALIFERSGNAYSIEPFFTNAPTVSAIFDFPVITADDTFVFEDTIQTLTNKTATGTNNTITAKFLRCSAAEVDVFASAAPVAGQVLTATSGTTATWQSAAASQSTPTDPASTSSLTGVMMGLAGSITPTTSGRVMVVISGSMNNDTPDDGCAAQIRIGTGAAPANGAALTGTAYGSLITSANPTTTGANTGIYPFSLNAVTITPILTVGTTYWVDVSLAAVTGGTAMITNISITLTEL